MIGAYDNEFDTNIRKLPAYAEIYVNGNTTAGNVPTGASFTKMIIPSSTKGNEKNCTVDLTAGTITANKSGKYLVNATFSSKLGTTDVIWDTAIFVNNTEATNLHMRRRFSTSGYTFNVCLIGIVTLSAGDVLDIRSKHNNAASVAITTEYANINITKID